MYLWLKDYDYYEIENHPFVTKSYTKDYFDWSSQLSVQAHKISKDYVHYVEMNFVEYRKKLEEEVANAYGQGRSDSPTK